MQVKLIRKVSDHWWVIKTNLGAQGEVPAKQLEFYRENAESSELLFILCDFSYIL